MGLGLYQRFYVQLLPQDTRISSSVLSISHHDRHHGTIGTLITGRVTPRGRDTRTWAF